MGRIKKGEGGAFQKNASFILSQCSWSQIGSQLKWSYDSGIMSHPKQLKAFLQWSKLMQEQATVPDRLQYKGVSVKGKKSRRKKRKKRFRSRKRRPQDD